MSHLGQFRDNEQNRKDPMNKVSNYLVEIHSEHVWQIEENGPEEYAELKAKRLGLYPWQMWPKPAFISQSYACPAAQGSLSLG